jgi:hypothetical protein
VRRHPRFALVEGDRTAQAKAAASCPSGRAMLARPFVGPYDWMVDSEGLGEPWRIKTGRPERDLVRPKGSAGHWTQAHSCAQIG